MSNQFLKIALFVFKYDFIIFPVIIVLIFIAVGLPTLAVICSGVILVCVYKSGLINMLIYKFLGINVNDIVAEIKQKLGK